MKVSKIYKFLGVISIVTVLTGSLIYFQLKPRHKAIIKTWVLHHTGFVDNKWVVEQAHATYRMVSPDLYLDGIYKSMEGPKVSNVIQLTQDENLIFITGFEVKALDAATKKPVTSDFICHTNIDFNDVKYYSGLGMNNRIGKQYPRMTSLSHGQEKFLLPDGYGIPMKGNDFLFVTTQSLNHNLPDINRFIKHEVAITYSKKQDLKPLMSRTVFIELPYDTHDPYKEPLDPASNQCIPVETKNHSYPDGKGGMLSGHWVVPTGKKTYQSSINAQLQIKDSLRLQAAAVHVHPFATSITLYDKTAQKIVFHSTITNHLHSIGLTKIDAFSSKEGVMMYATHDYELVEEVNNTTAVTQDMMGSMFLFFYDAELDQKLKNK